MSTPEPRSGERDIVFSDGDLAAILAGAASGLRKRRDADAPLLGLSDFLDMAVARLCAREHERGPDIAAIALGCSSAPTTSAPEPVQGQEQPSGWRGAIVALDAEAERIRGTRRSTRKLHAMEQAAAFLRTRMEEQDG